MNKKEKIKGKCLYCGLEFTEDDYKHAELGDINPETGEISPIGDYDFVCYNCQLELMNSGKWLDFVKNKGIIFTDP